MSLGDALSIAGLAVAIYQIFRTGRIVTATHRSVERTAQQLGVYTLLLLVPELSLIEHQLDAAAMQDNRDEVKRLLREWQTRASELRGLLRTEPVAAEDLASLVQDSIALATQAKVSVDRGLVLHTATQKVRAACESVCLQARSVAAEVRSRAPAQEPTQGVWEDLVSLYGFKTERKELR